MKEVMAYNNTVTVKMTNDQHFGDYSCTANNGLTPSDSVIAKIQQIKEPGATVITSSDADIQATSLTVKWNEPTDDGGSPITAYRVVILRTGTEIRYKNITDPSTTSLSIGGLDKGTQYTVKVFARNFVFEGPAGSWTVQTKDEGAPAAAELVNPQSEVKVEKVTLNWNEPDNNGAAITQYTVYQRTVNEDGTTGVWNQLKIITNVLVRKFVVKLETGKEYEFIVTATNKFGEGLKELEKIKKVKVLGGVPGQVKLIDLPEEVRGTELTLQWTEPETNGAPITHYTVYQRTVNTDGTTDQMEPIVITDITDRKYDVKVEEGKEYEFLVTATNKYGEGAKDESSFQKVKVLTGSAESNKEKALPRENRRTCSRCKDTIAMNPMVIETERGAKSDNATYEIPNKGDYMSLHPSTRSWEMRREQVNIVKVIGKGAFSQVAKATACNTSGSHQETTVAVKMLKADAPESDRKDLLSELELMKKLKPHPHVIKLIGCVTESDPLLVLIEYVPYGDLLGYLRKSRGLNDTYFKDPDVKPQTSLTAEQLLKFAWQIADGMCYLSSRKIIHRDLAARNVLVGEGEKCKVTDFGMSRNVEQDDIYTRKSRGRLPVKWTAYEALLYGTYTTQSDVWSYGVVLYEILTVGGTPYPDIHGRQIANKLQEGYRMPKPQHVDSKLYQVMLQCWQESPRNRPTFAKLRGTMKEMEKNHRTYVNLKQYDNSLYANVKDLADG